jgi:site-specific DNA-methyltransferase (adenine-specific)
LDVNADSLRRRLLPFCRLKSGDIYRDETSGHVVGCGDATDRDFVHRLLGDRKAKLAVQDPPYNTIMHPRLPVEEYVAWSRRWVENVAEIIDTDGALYVWIGANQDDHFQPLPQFMAMMAQTDFRSRSLITMRNQRGYGTQRNWMAVRQELLYYTVGSPAFTVQYTDIPRVLRGYYKDVNGARTENRERSHSPTIRPGNVWVDLQQVFYRLEENVSGCYAQKPLSAIERIVLASSKEGDVVVDFFGHSGTTLLACERTGRLCITGDIDPIFAEITLRRLEQYRQCRKTGWQMSNPFENELANRAGECGTQSRDSVSLPTGAGL